MFLMATLRFRFQDEPVDFLQRAGAFDKDVPSSAVDHHFSHARIEQ
jgi:hypothetical protein